MTRSAITGHYRNAAPATYTSSAMASSVGGRSVRDVVRIDVEYRTWYCETTAGLLVNLLRRCHEALESVVIENFECVV
jgi:hypothetical protein